MKQLIITQNNIYQVGDINYFKFTIGNRTYRDNNCDLSKLNKYILEIICKYCELEYKGLKKSQLIELLNENNCIIMNNN
jgi:septum formation topological specificity factor MinE